MDNSLKYPLIIIIVVLLGLGSWRYFKDKLSPSQYNGFSIENYTLDNKQYRFLVADTPQKSEQGLMFVRSLAEAHADGMVFIFPDRNYRSFWNKNTYMNLDIYWVVDHKTVGKSILPSVEKNGIVTVSSNKPVDAVIEMPQK